MKNTGYFKRLTYIFLLLYFILYSCEKNANNNQPEIIGKSAELIAYEAIIGQINNNVVECTTFVALSDGSGSVIINYTDNDDIKISMINTSGTVIWDLVYGPPGNRVLNFGEIIQATDGSFMLTGGLDVSDYNMDVFLLKISNDGKIVWEQTYDISEWETARAIEQTSDGGYIMAGVTCPYYLKNDYVVIKTDEDGLLEWQNTYGTYYNYDYAKDIIITDNDEYIMIGRMDWIPKIHRIDQSGNIIWEIILPYVCDGITKANDEGFIVLAGHFNHADSTTIIGLEKRDESGNYIWRKHHTPSKNITEPILIKNTLNSGYYVIVEEEDIINDEIYYSIYIFNNSGELIN